MLTNATWAGMIALGLTVTVYCEPCGKIVELDLTKMPPDGKATGVRFKCRECGRHGRSTVSSKEAARASRNGKGLV